jgi:hypothetical protein
MVAIVGSYTYAAELPILKKITRLSRKLLMDVSWFLAGALLANNHHLRYVIVSSDSRSGYSSSIGHRCTCR